MSGPVTCASGLTGVTFPSAIGVPASASSTSTGGRQGPPKDPAPACTPSALLDRVFPADQCDEWWGDQWAAMAGPFRWQVHGPMQTHGERPTGWRMP